jgi:hypothetical protein
MIGHHSPLHISMAHGDVRQLEKKQVIIDYRPSYIQETQIERVKSSIPKTVRCMKATKNKVLIVG